jgi:TRPM family ion channel/conflict system pore-forming effector with SLATT domain/uncharacterized protein DUF4231
MVPDPGSGPIIKWVEAGESDSPAELLAKLRLRRGGRPVILVCGGAKLRGKEAQLCRKALGPAVSQAACVAGAAVVDGGTDAGVMSIVGRARAADRSAIRVLVGVAPRRKVRLPGERGDGVAFEPNHTHAVLAPGAEFGDERETLFDTVAALAGRHPVAVVLAGGGTQAREEALETVHRGWPLLVLAGTGGTADAVACRKGPVHRQWWPLSALARIGRMAGAVARRLGWRGDEEIAGLAEYERTTIVEQDGAGLAAHLVWTLIRDRPVLKSAWCRYAAYENAAARMQDRYVRTLRALLFVGIAATALAVWQQDLADANVTAGDVARWCVIVLPSLLVGLGGWNRHQALGKQWIVLRAAAEAIKGETFRYRTQTAPYGENVRDNELQDRTNLIHRQVLATEAAMTSLSQPAETDPPSNLDEEGLTDLDIHRYASRRIENQRNWYRRKVKEKARKRDACTGLTLAAGIAGTGLAAAGIEPAVAVTTAIATALAGYLAARQYAEDVINYNRTAAELDFEAAQATRTTPDGLKELVQRTEEILVVEVGGWAQRMARALAREEQRQTELARQHGGPT